MQSANVRGHGGGASAALTVAATIIAAISASAFELGSSEAPQLRALSALRCADVTPTSTSIAVQSAC